MGKRSREKKKRKDERARAPEPKALAAEPSASSAPRLRVWILAAVLVAVSVGAVYSHVLETPFQFDDHRTVVSNLSIREFGHWDAMFQFAPSRFFLTLSFALDYHFSELDPRGYHLTNLFIHGLNALLVFGLLFSGALGRAAARWGVALSAALVFTAHPVNTEAVTYISGRSSSLSALFFLGAFWAWTRYSKEPSAGRWAAAFGLFLLGLPTKETVAMLPFALLGYELFFGNFRGWRALLKNRFKSLAPFFALPVLGLLLRSAAAGLPDAYVYRPYGVHLLSQFKVFFLQLGLFLFPRGLTVDHDVSEAGLSSPAAWLSLLGLAFLGYLAWRFRKNAPGFGFGALWAFAASLPLILIPLQDLMMEHWGYLANLGWLFALAWGAGFLVEHFGKNAALRTGLAAFALLLVFGLGFAAFQRNTVWQSDVTLWQDAAEKSPDKGRPWVNLAAAHFIQGNFDEALACYEKASTRKGAFLPRVYLGMGRIYFEKKHDLQNAEKYLLLAVEHGPEVWDAWARLGYIYRERGEYQKAVEAMEKVRVRGRENYTLQFMLGDCYFRLGNFEAAREALIWADYLKPGDFFTSLRLGQLFETTGNWVDALTYYDQALNLRPDDSRLRERRDFVQEEILKNLPPG